MVDVRQTKEHAAYLKAIGWVVERSSSGMYAYIKKMPLIPVSVIKIQRVSVAAVDFAWVKKLVQRYRALLVYIEIDHGVISGHGFRASRSPMLPTKTLVVDLHKSTAQLVSEMKSKTRYNIGLAGRKKLAVAVITGDKMIANQTLFNEYYELMRHNAVRLKTFEIPKSWIVAQLEAFGDKSFVVMIRNRASNLLAAAMYVTSSNTVFYSHNGSTAEGRTMFAPTLAVWEGMKEGKRRGLSWFDFEGIYDERHPLPRWKGFTRFKLGFGGQVIAHPPVYHCLLPQIRLLVSPPADRRPR